MLLYLVSVTRDTIQISRGRIFQAEKIEQIPGAGTCMASSVAERSRKTVGAGGREIPGMKAEKWWSGRFPVAKEI